MLGFLRGEEVPMARRGSVVINPSFCGEVWVWREGASWQGPFEGMWQAPGVGAMPLRALPAFEGVDVLADPKLWRWGDGVGVTFNTGWDGGANRLFYAPLYPEAGAPVELKLEGRWPVEKNWGFFEDGGRVHAFYGWDPEPVFLRETDEVGRFERFGPQAKGTNHKWRSIGTQPVPWEGRWYFMAHRRGRIRRKRWYIGELWSFGRVPGGFGDLRREGGPWAHSPIGLLGLGAKRNPHLFSCTYFSALERDPEGHWRVGYGVNDRSAHVARLPI